MITIINKYWLFTWSIPPKKASYEESCHFWPVFEWTWQFFVMKFKLIIIFKFVFRGHLLPLVILLLLALFYGSHHISNRSQKYFDWEQKEEKSTTYILHWVYKKMENVHLGKCVQLKKIKIYIHANFLGPIWKWYYSETVLWEEV